MTNINYYSDKLEHLSKSVNYEEASKYIKRYMQLNNFKIHEIEYIFRLMDFFYFINRASLEKDLNHEN